MFKFLKDKVKNVAEKFSKSEELGEVKEQVLDESEHKKEKKSIIKIVKEKISHVVISENKFEELFWDLEIELMEFNVAVEVIELIKEDLKKEIVDNKFSRNQLYEIIRKKLYNIIEQVLKESEPLEKLAKTKPYKILVLGVNGSGKTTTLAKIIKYLQKKKKSIVVAACDTFRAAAIQQLEEHTTELGVKLVKHDYGSDSAAVAFDAVKHAEASNKDFVLIDSAGRSHANTNLMDELEKLVRISKPDLKIFVADSLTGNDAVEQARTFNEKIGIDAIILTKVDADEKGGAVVSISHITKKPILFLGVGQEYNDLKRFSIKDFMNLLQE